MRTESVTFITVQDIASILAKFFGVPTCSNWIDTMSCDAEWGRGSFQYFDVEPKGLWISENHNDHLEEARTRGHVEWPWELCAILNEAGEAGELPLGSYAVRLLDDPPHDARPGRRVVTVLDWKKDVVPLLTQIIGWKNDSNWVSYMEPSQYGNDTVHLFEITSDTATLPEHATALAAARARGRVVTEEELAAVLNQAVSDGCIPARTTILEICW